MEKVKTNNRSVRHTKSRIKEGFLSLLNQKPVQEVSVKELTDFIDLNRGTFYTHYSDIYDLLDEMKTEMFEEMEKILSSSYTSSEGYTEAIFAYLGENADFTKILLGEHGDMAFVSQLKKSISSHLSYFWSKLNKDLDDLDYDILNTYIINGFIGIIEIYLNNPDSEISKHIVHYADKLTTDTINNFINSH